MLRRRVIALGGGSRSELWTQIVSDVTGETLECIERPYGAELADAYLAGYGVGLFDDLAELRDKWIRVGRRVSPRPEVSRVYERYYAVYRRLYERTQHEMHELACLNAPPPMRR